MCACAYLLPEGVVGDGLDHLARRRLDDERAIVERGELHVEATERLRERDRPLDEEVIALALVLGVRLLLEHKDDVARLAVGDLVGLLGVVDLVPVGRALGHVHLECLLHLP